MGLIPRLGFIVFSNESYFLDFGASYGFWLSTHTLAHKGQYVSLKGNIDKHIKKDVLAQNVGQLAMLEPDINNPKSVQIKTVPTVAKRKCMNEAMSGFCFSLFALIQSITDD